MSDTVESNPSLDQLERETEQNRAQVSRTMDQLRARVSETAQDLQHRVSPHVIKEDVKQYISQRGKDAFHNFERAAWDNPLQAVAIGAGLAYPAFKILRSLPAPIFLIGAGVALAGMGRLRDRIPVNVEDRARQAYDDLADAGQNAKDHVIGAADNAHAQVLSSVDAVSTSARNAFDNMADVGSQIKDAVGNASSITKTGISDLASSLSKAASETASYSREQVALAGRAAQGTFSGAVDRNPLVVGGLGLLIGAIVAASLPATRMETTAFGDASDALKARGSKFAADGYVQATEMGERVLDQTVESAAAEGLDLESAREDVQQLGDKLKSVAEHASGLVQSSGSKSPHDVSDRSKETMGDRS